MIRRGAPSTSTLPSLQSLEKRQRYFERLSLVYLNMWILEGALRKWFLPSLSSPLYFARDLIFVAALVFAPSMPGFRRRHTGVPALLLLLALLVLVVSVAQLLFGTVTLPVAIMGLRSYLIVALVPIILLAEVSDSLLARLRNALLWWLPIQAILVLWQSTSPASSFANAVTGGDGSQISLAGDYSRASGTFPSPLGLGYFFLLVVAIWLGGVSSQRKITRRDVLHGLCLFAIAFLSGSRTTLGFGVLGLFVVALSQVRRNPKFIGKFGVLVLVGAAVFFAMSQVFVGTFGAINERISSANQHEDVIGRIEKMTFGYLHYPLTVDGSGVGAHTVAGIQAGSSKEWIEIDSQRLVAELGMIGLALALVRQVCAVALVIWGLRRSTGRLFPDAAVMSLPLAAVLMSGQVTTSPETQGFGVIAILYLLLCERSIHKGVGRTIDPVNRASLNVQ